MSVNYSDTTPTAPSGRLNAKWQGDSAGNISVNVPIPIEEISAAANEVLATPDGSSGFPTMRALVAGDIPALAESKITNLTTDLAGKVPTTRTISTTAPLTGGGDLSADRTLAISNFTGDSGSGGAKGAVPAPSAGDAAAGKFLKADGTFAVPPGTTSGTVTSVGLTVPSWLSVSGSPVTGSGTLAVTATSGETANEFLATPDGSTGAVGLRAIVAGDLPLATTGAFGAVKPDGSTVTISGGVLSSSGGTTIYSGSADAIAGNGQNTVTLGSTPVANSWKVFLNGVLMPITVLSISGAVITYTGTWTAGDLISATWATTNATPGSITLGSTDVTIRGTNFVTSGTFVAFPAGTAVGDLGVLFLSSTSASQTIPSGWTSQFNPSVTFWSGAVATKTLTFGDLAAGGITFSGSSITGLAVLIGAPALMEVKAVSGASNTTPVSLTTTGSASAGYTALYFGSNIATGTDTVNRGTLDQSGNNGTNAGMLYAEILGSSGTVSATFSYSSGNAKNFDAIVVYQTTLGAPGALPEIQQSQVIGLPALASSAATILTTTGTSGAATLAGNTLNVPNYSSSGAGGGQSLVLLESHIASSSAELDFTVSISSTYDQYVIEIINLIPATNAVSCLLQFSTNGGSSYDSGANYSHQSWRWVFNNDAVSGSNSGSTSITLDGGAGTDKLSSTTANGGLCGSFRLFNPLSAASYKILRGETVFMNSGGTWDGASMSAQYLSTTAANAFRISMSSGNIASGTVRVYGIAH